VVCLDQKSKAGDKKVTITIKADDATLTCAFG
jgi:hypothetical protein